MNTRGSDGLLEVNGTQLYREGCGNGPWVVLIPGVTGDWFERLAERAVVVGPEDAKAKELKRHENNKPR